MVTWKTNWTREFFDIIADLSSNKQDEIIDKVIELVKSIEENIDKGFADWKKTIKSMNFEDIYRL